VTAITVLLVDDHILVRRGFRRLLEDDPSISVVGEASNAGEAVKINVERAPNVVLMDYALPGVNGITTLIVLVGQAGDIDCAKLWLERATTKTPNASSSRRMTSP